MEFDARYFERLVAARRHWWVEGMRRVGEALLDEHRAGLSVLDAGCGSGALLEWLGTLAHPRPVVGIDAAWAGLVFAKDCDELVTLTQASLAALPFAPDRFDVVVTADVLQHLPSADASAALIEIARVLRPGGRVLVRTNSRCGRAAVDDRDDWRLYTSGSLRAALEAAGLVVDVVTPVNSLQGLWASVRGRRRSHHDPHHGHEGGAEPTVLGGCDARPEWGSAGLGIPRAVAPWRNRVQLMLLQAEARWLRGGRRRLPFGHSLYAVARRR